MELKSNEFSIQAIQKKQQNFSKNSEEDNTNRYSWAKKHIQIYILQTLFFEGIFFSKNETL